MRYNFCACPLHSRITSQVLQWGWQRWMEISLWSGGILPLPPVCLQLPPRSCCQDRDKHPPLHMNLISPPPKPPVYTCLLLLPDVSTTWKQWFEKKKKHSELTELRPPSLLPLPSASVQAVYMVDTKLFKGTQYSPWKHLHMEGLEKQSKSSSAPWLTVHS